jgi:L-lactate dehydrogenase (cytochrome)
VQAATTGPTFYQLYLFGGRDVATASIARARAAKYAALVVTIDTSVAGYRERDIRNGLSDIINARPKALLRLAGQALRRPHWLAQFVAERSAMSFPNVILPGGEPMRYVDPSASLEHAAITWDDLRWIREVWQGPLIIKGVHTGDDARRAIDSGAEAVVVSNHGGRQLDGVPPTLRMLPEVLRAADGRIEVLMDGGIRRGSDVVKALCLGARAVLVGRAYAYGLAAAGSAGVTRAIDILKNDIVRTLKLLGCDSIHRLDRSFVNVGFRETYEPGCSDSPHSSSTPVHVRASHSGHV